MLHPTAGAPAEAALCRRAMGTAAELGAGSSWAPECRLGEPQSSASRWCAPPRDRTDPPGHFANTSPCPVPALAALMGRAQAVHGAFFDQG